MELITCVTETLGNGETVLGLYDDSHPNIVIELFGSKFFSAFFRNCPIVHLDDLN
jgi:hypothetical protein